MIIIKNILVIGSINMDFVVELDKIPTPGETVLGKSFSLIPGGKGANQAYAMGKLGANVKMIGAIGNDEYGKILLNNLNSVGVNTDSITVIDDINTGCAFINVDASGENNIVVVSGANSFISTDMINRNITLIDEADIIVMQLEIPLEVVTYVADIAKKKGKLVILDPAPAVNNLPKNLLSNIDIMKPNETEIRILTDDNIENEEDMINAAKKLIESGVKSVIVSLGDKGSVFVTKDSVKKHYTLNVDVVDTTAAGDSFVAGLAVSLADGKNMDEAISFAHLVSSIVVTKKGAQNSIPSLEEVNKFVEERKFYE